MHNKIMRSINSFDKNKLVNSSFNINITINSLKESFLKDGNNISTNP